MSIVVSIVTGTYNRLPHLRNMIESTRQSIGVGIPYEIVVVDGGSTDGTLEWCRVQPDVVLIEQGELLGAVKAFNAGFAAARGLYCIPANDDITFVDESIIAAIAFMQDNRNVGVGCFWQDRAPKEMWHIEYMPAILNGRQINVAYGQVCIVPKWLGDLVGWWGTETRTYGGDNELSANVWERGYQVSPCCEWIGGGDVPWVAIHDAKFEDELRRINNTGTNSQDGRIWGQKWTRRLNGKSMTGPVIASLPKPADPMPRFRRYLYLPIYEQGYPIQKQQKRGLRQALAQRGLVVEVDYLQIAAQAGGSYMRDYVMDIADCWKPDVILFQAHTPNTDTWNADHIRLLRNEYPNAKILNWNGDYHPEDLLSSAGIEFARQFHIQMVVTTDVAKAYQKAGVEWRYWQIGYEDGIGVEQKSPNPDAQVVFLGNGYSAKRVELGRMLRGLPYRVALYGKWAAIRSDGDTLYDFDTGRAIYQNAQIAVGDDQWRAGGFVSNRLFQAMAAGGCLYMQQRVPGLEELLGIQDGVHYVAWSTFADLREKIEFWLDPLNEPDRKRIAAEGCEFVRKNHSFLKRVEELERWI